MRERVLKQPQTKIQSQPNQRIDLPAVLFQNYNLLIITTNTAALIKEGEEKKIHSSGRLSHKKPKAIL